MGRGDRDVGRGDRDVGRGAHRLFAVLAAVLALTPAAAQAAWNQPVASSLNVSTSEDGQNPQTANVGGTPYVAWFESNGTANQVYVKRFTGTAWAQVGSGSLNIDPTQSAYDPSIASVGGVPYVAWWENNGGTQRIFVKRFDGSSWVQVGSGPLNVNAGETAAYPSITDIGGVPYVAWNETNGTGYQTYVSRFDGSSWVQVGSSLNIVQADNAAGPSITSVGGVPYVAWTEVGVNPYRVYVKRFDGSSWVEVGTGPLNLDPAQIAAFPSIASIAGVPYVAWTEGNGSIYVKRFDGTSWSQVGNGALNIDPTASAGAPTIASVGGAPLVGWQEYNGSVREIYVSRFNGSTWTHVGGSLNVDSTKDAYFYSDPTVIDVGGVPYASWSESDGTHYQIRVKRLEPDILSESATPSAGSATLTAQVNDYGVPLPVGFDYGTSTSFGHRTALATSAGIGTSTVTESVLGLMPNTTYFYRPFGSDTVRETSQGATQKFLTLVGPALFPLRISPSKFSLSGRQVHGRCVKQTRANQAAKHCRRRVSLRVSYNLLVTTTVTITLQLEVRGRKVNGQCVKPTHRNRKRGKCTRLLSVPGSITLTGSPGANRFAFDGRVGGRALGPGSYLLTATPSGGTASTAFFELV